MTRYVEHSDSWAWAPPIPFKHWVGWYVSNDDGDPMRGPFETEAEAREELTDLADPAVNLLDEVRAREGLAS